MCRVVNEMQVSCGVLSWVNFHSFPWNIKNSTYRLSYKKEEGADFYEKQTLYDLSQTYDKIL